jgi:hypothetical protein
MSNETVKKTTSSKRAQPSSRTTESKAEAPVDVHSSEDSQVKKVPNEVDLNQYITVRNGFQGMLIYISKKTGEVFEWDEFGAEQEMELGELKNAKNSNKAFFINNWFMFDDPWVIDYLGVRQYYKNSVSVDDFDEIFNKDPDEIARIIRSAPEGQKHSIAYRAQQLIAENAIDSLKTIAVLKQQLGIDPGTTLEDR